MLNEADMGQFHRTRFFFPGIASHGTCIGTPSSTGLENGLSITDVDQTQFCNQSINVSNIGYYTDDLVLLLRCRLLIPHRQLVKIYTLTENDTFMKWAELLCHYLIVGLHTCMSVLNTS